MVRVRLRPFDRLFIIVVALIGVIGVLGGLRALSDSIAVTVPARGGSYHEGIVGVPRFINPVLAVSDADRDLTALVYSGLMRHTKDGAVTTDLASVYSTSEDGTEYTFVLDERARFSDGTKVTAEDVAFTIALAQNPLIKSPKRANWEGVGVTVSDERTIQFKLKNAYAPFLENTTIGILPKHVWGDITPEEFQFSTRNIEAIGSGPFAINKIESSARGIPATMELTANQYAKSRPYLDSIMLTFYQDAPSLTAAVEADTSLGGHSLSTRSADSHTTHTAVLNRVFGVFYNQSRNDVFAEKAVRDALDAALDKNALVATLVSGFGSPATGPLPPSSVTATTVSTSTQDELLREAREILTRAGWTEGQDGIFEKTVKKKTRKLAFTLATSNVTELKTAADYVAKTWTELGVQVDVQLFESGDLQQEIIRPRAYDALLFGEAVGRELDLYAFWHSSQRNDPGLNIAGYVNPAVDKLLTEARQEPDALKRSDLLTKAAGIISDESAATFLYTPHFVYTLPKAIQGVYLGSITTVSDRFAFVDSWYTKQDKIWPIFVR